MTEDLEKISRGMRDWITSDYTKDDALRERALSLSTDGNPQTPIPQVLARADAYFEWLKGE